MELNQDQIEIIKYRAPCDIKGCSGHSTSDFGAIRLKGDGKEFVICNKCLKETTMLLMMNEGV